MAIILLLFCIIYSIHGQYTVINGTWPDDFAYDASGISGWSNNIQGAADSYQYHGDYSSSSNTLHTLDRYFQCAYNSIVYISFSISFDCDCDTSDWVQFLVNNAEQAQYDNTEPTTPYQEGGGNQCSGNWFRFDSPTFNIPSITSSDIFHLRFDIQTLLPDGSNKSPQILIWNIIIQCYFISSAPTLNPTKSPSFNPTKNPTHIPTHIPSELPTKNPTMYPSQNPSKNPTKNPTTNPTKNPTKSPTKFPTSSPTEIVTFDPTQSPTSYPTKSPTSLPTSSPISEAKQISTTTVEDTTTTAMDDEDEMAITGSSNSSLEIIIGVIGGATLILCCMFIVFLFYRERSRKEIRKKELKIQMEKIKMQHTTMASTSAFANHGDEDIDTKDLKRFNVNLSAKNTYNALPGTPITPETVNVNEGKQGIVCIVPLPPQPMVEGDNNNITPGDDMSDDSDENDNNQQNQSNVLCNKDSQENDMDDMYKSVVTVENGE